MHALYYPPADRKSQWYGPGNSTMPMKHVKWLQHTTETAGGWPGYSGGADAPTLTYEPWQHKWRQHFPINGSARALQNDGSFQTNRADVVQTEISCYCDPSLYGKYGHAVTMLDDQALDDLAAFAAWMHTEWGMDLQLVGKPWPPYPQSLNIDRLTDSAFAGFSGICGHEHAPGNVHGDPGAIDNAAILTRARNLVEGDDMTKADMLEVLQSAEGQKAIADAILGADAIDIPEGAYSDDYRKKNPTFTVGNALTQIWKWAVKGAGN